MQNIPFQSEAKIYAESLRSAEFAGEVGKLLIVANFIDVHTAAFGRGGEIGLCDYTGESAFIGQLRGGFGQSYSRGIMGSKYQKKADASGNTRSVDLTVSNLDSFPSISLSVYSYELTAALAKMGLADLQDSPLLVEALNGSPRSPFKTTLDELEGMDAFFIQSLPVGYMSLSSLQFFNAFLSDTFFGLTGERPLDFKNFLLSIKDRYEKGFNAHASIFYAVMYGFYKKTQAFMSLQTAPVINNEAIDFYTWDTAIRKACEGDWEPLKLAIAGDALLLYGDECALQNSLINLAVALDKRSDRNVLSLYDSSAW